MRETDDLYHSVVLFSKAVIKSNAAPIGEAGTTTPPHRSCKALVNRGQKSRVQALEVEQTLGEVLFEDGEGFGGAGHGGG